MEIRKRRAEQPEFRPFISIERQLEYLIDLDEGRRSDVELMANLNLGLVAARELEPNDMEMANLIYEVTASVREMIKEL